MHNHIQHDQLSLTHLHSLTHTHTQAIGRMGHELSIAQRQIDNQNILMKPYTFFSSFLDFFFCSRKKIQREFSCLNEKREAHFSGRATLFLLVFSLSSF